MSRCLNHDNPREGCPWCLKDMKKRKRVIELEVKNGTHKCFFWRGKGKCMNGCGQTGTGKWK